MNMTPTTVYHALSTGPVIGYRYGWPVSAIVPQEGRTRVRMSGTILYIPPTSVITFGDNSEIVVSDAKPNAE
jgi:hypothetical protein